MPIDPTSRDRLTIALLVLLTSALLLGCKSDHKPDHKPQYDQGEALAKAIDNLGRAIRWTQEQQPIVIRDELAPVTAAIPKLRNDLLAAQTQIAHLQAEIDQLRKPQTRTACPECLPRCCPGPCEKCECSKLPMGVRWPPLSGGCCAEPPRVIHVTPPRPKPSTKKRAELPDCVPPR